MSLHFFASLGEMKQSGVGEWVGLNLIKQNPFIRHHVLI